MSYYDPQAWQLPGQMRDLREPSWEQQQAPSRTETGSAMQGTDAGAFHSQIEDVDRAIDNLAKSGKLFNQPGRRDSMPMMGGPESFSNFQPSRMGGMGGRHHSVDYSDQMRPQSGSGLQNFYANQRHQSRPNEAEQMMQAKRRMAAQRERELRNYHQEQQYNRNVSTKGGNPDRAISPNTINEEDRRELIARQHRALYGNESSPYNEGSGFGDDGHTPRPSYPNSGTASAAGGRGPSPRTYDPFAMGQNQQQQQNMNEQGGQFKSNEQNQSAGGKGPSPNPQQQAPRAESTSSPASNPPGQNFPLFESAAQQSSRTSTSSPGGSPPRQQGKTSAPGVAPIGTRPNPSQSINLAPNNNNNNNKRTGTPSLSPLNNTNFENNLNAPSSGGNANERSTSAASNPTGGASNKDSNVSAWGQSNNNSGGGSGPWGSNNSKPLGVQASVWG